VQSDFDRIAELSAGLPDRPGPGERWLLRQLPARIERALDVGCGAGFTSRQLARRSQHVLAIDLSPRMIELARQRSAGVSNLSFEVADVMSMKLPCGAFGCVVSVSTLHHLPMEPALRRLRELVGPGGVLCVLDLVQPVGWLERTVDLIAAPMLLASWVSRRAAGALSQAWKEHGARDRYPTLAEVRQVCHEVLPGALVRRHPRCRYSIRWTKPHPR
jgi:SAM-dependent methyltransferase